MPAAILSISSLKTIRDSVLYSYTQLFFSQNRWFALLLLLASFVDPGTGIGGILAVIITNSAAYYIGFPVISIVSGAYGFNSLLVGLGLGSFYAASPVFYVVLIFASLLTLMMTVWLNGILSKYTLPSLSLPFLFAIWLVVLALKQFSNIELSERSIYWLNEVYKWGGNSLVDFYTSVEEIGIPDIIKVYLKSLGAIFFQHNIITGTLIALGLLLSSRIAFSLSLIGFFFAYFFYKLVGANLLDLHYHFIGFNFILTAIAVGGFFFIPSLYSYLWVLLLTPVISIITIGSNVFFSTYQLPVYSLSFNLTVILFMYVMMLRQFPKGIKIVSLQNFQPEKNLYKYLNANERLKNNHYLQLQLPFWGDWMVSQGHDGKITHLGDWSKAFDFVILDEEMKTYKDEGKLITDYYCFNKPVLAPADGIVEETVDYLEDNLIGEVNLARNWGNTIVIRHLPGLYTQLSHLKQHSIKVKKGDYVKKGDIIAACGSSGRSPEPHLHFQVQATPYIGSQTLSYPIAYYMSKENQHYRLHAYEHPREGQWTCNTEGNPLLKNTFGFIPGKKLNYEFTNEKGEKELMTWEILTNSYNQTYIYCKSTSSYAYYVNDGTLFYFTDFEGNHSSLLYYFYLGAYKIVLGYYQGMTIHDKYPENIVNMGAIAQLQDFVAPFYRFVDATYTLTYKETDSIHHTTSILLSSATEIKLAGKNLRSMHFTLLLERNCIRKITIHDNNKVLEAICIEQ